MYRCCQGPQGPHTRSDRQVGTDSLRELQKLRAESTSEEGRAAIDEQIRLLKESLRSVSGLSAREKNLLDQRNEVY